jgi:hypothetical protein
MMCPLLTGDDQSMPHEDSRVAVAMRGVSNPEEEVAPRCLQQPAVSNQISFMLATFTSTTYPQPILSALGTKSFTIASLQRK